MWDIERLNKIKRLDNLINQKRNEQLRQIIMKNLTFGEALEAVKEGKLIAREGWNGKGMFVFMRPSDNIEVQTIVEKVKSIPDSVKLYLANKYKGDYIGVSTNEPFKITFTSYLCMKDADDTIVNGWLASQTDMLANDWQIL